MAQPTPPQEHVQLTLFQIISRSDCSVHVRVADGAGKFARVEVLETLSGVDPGKTLRIDFRDLNLSLKGQEAVVFETGEEDILFLHRPDWRKPSPKNADIFELMHGRRGRLILPPEGAGVFLDAVRRLAQVTKKDPTVQAEGLRQLLTQDNPFLREAVLAEAGRLQMMSTADLPMLVRLLGDASPGLREQSLQQIRTVLKAATDPEPGDEVHRALEAARERARNDPDENVRAEAVRAMSAWNHRDDVVPDLHAIATGDPSQLVRYEAQRVLYLWGR